MMTPELSNNQQDNNHKNNMTHNQTENDDTPTNHANPIITKPQQEQIHSTLRTSPEQNGLPTTTTTTNNTIKINTNTIVENNGANSETSLRNSVCSSTQETNINSSSNCTFDDESESIGGNASTTLSTSLVSACSTAMMMQEEIQSSNEKEFEVEMNHGNQTTSEDENVTERLNGTTSLGQVNSLDQSESSKYQESNQQPVSRLSIGDILKGLKSTNVPIITNPSSNKSLTIQSKDNSSTQTNSSNIVVTTITTIESPKKKISDPVLPQQQIDSKTSTLKRKKKTSTVVNENNSSPSLNSPHHRNPSETTYLVNDITQSPHKRKLSLSVAIQNKISTWRSKHKKNISTDQTTPTTHPPLLLLENNQQYSHLLSEKSQSATDTFNTSISSMNSFVSNTSEVDFKHPILIIKENSPETPRKSSNPQIQSLRNILATNRQRFFSSANDLASQYSDVSPMVYSPSSPFSEEKTFEKSPKISLLNFSQIVPTLIEDPKSSRTQRGGKKTILDYITQGDSPKRKLSLPAKPEFLNSPKHTKKNHEAPHVSLVYSDEFNLSPPTPISIPNITPRHQSPKETEKLENMFCADTLLLICSYINGGFQFCILRLVCKTWDSFLDDDVVWKAMYLNYLENLTKIYWGTIGSYYGSTEHHPKSGSQPKKKEEISIKYKLLNKRHKFLKSLQKELTTAKPAISNSLPEPSNELIHVRRGTIANFKQLENLETRRRTSSSTERLTSPRFDDLSNFVGFGFQNPTSPPSITVTPSLMSPRKHAHSTASLFDMKKTIAKKSKRPKQEQMEELTPKQIYIELVKDEVRSRIRIALNILQPVQLVKCLVDKDYTVSRMTFFFFPPLYSPVAKFLKTSKSIIVGKLHGFDKDQFMTDIFQHLSVQFFSLFLLGLKSLKANLISNPVDFPEFYGELKKIMPSENSKCSNSTEAQFLADKLITKYFTLVVDRLNPEISFEVLSLFMDSFAHVGKNKLLILILEKAKEKFFDYDTQLTPRLTKMIAHGRGKLKRKSAENDLFHLLVDKIIPSAAIENADFRHIVDMLFDIMQIHYGIDNKQIASHFKKLTSTTTQSIVDPHISIIKACFQNNGQDTIAISFFEYLIDKFAIDMNRKDILFFLLGDSNTIQYMEQLKKTNKMDPKFVSRCFHSKHFAEFLVTQNARKILERIFTFFNIDPLADFENENSFKSIEEAWKSSINTGRTLIRSTGSFKNKDNFLKIISKIEIRNNEPKPVYNLDVLTIYKFLCTRFKEQDKKFNLQKIDRDLNIGVNLITHVFVNPVTNSVTNAENVYEMCDLLINHSNVLIDCKILKLILLKSEKLENQYEERNWMLLNIFNNTSKALELILNNSVMIIPKNPNSSMKTSMHGSDIIGFSEWYLNYKLTSDRSPLVEEYIQLFERTQSFIERNRIYGNSSDFGCFSCCCVQ